MSGAEISGTIIILGVLATMCFIFWIMANY